MSHKGCPYDNAVAEATFKTIKTEFVKNEIFTNTNELRQRFSAYAYWYNNNRLHSSLGYLTPMAFNKQLPLKVDLFYNEIDKIYQIGVIGYGGIFPAPQSCFVLEEIIFNLKIIHDIDIKK